MNKVILKEQIIDEMMSFKSAFEKVLYSKNYRFSWNNEENLASFTTHDAKQYLEIFLKVYREHYRDLISCGIIKINKNSIVVDKYFKMHSFINEMISLFDDVKCFVKAIDQDDKFMISSFI